MRSPLRTAPLLLTAGLLMPASTGCKRRQPPPGLAPVAAPASAPARASSVPTSRPVTAEQAARRKALEAAVASMQPGQPVIDPPPAAVSADYRDLDSLVRAGPKALGRVALLPVLSRGEYREHGENVVVSPCGRQEMGFIGWSDTQLRLSFGPGQRRAVGGLDHVYVALDNFAAPPTVCRWVRFALTGIDEAGLRGRLLDVYEK